MQRPPSGKIAAQPRDKLLWPVLGLLVAAQLVAFWMLCTHQVRKAEVREAALQVQSVAVADCLRYIPRATLSSCAQRVDPTRRPDIQIVGNGSPTASRAVMTSTVMPVGFAYR